jgi:hypothetical protein
MLQKLKLTCFRQHTDLEINFTPGLNAIRGANEAGKSGVLLAISYALFGSSALSQPLEEIVSYDVPVAKLKVELDFEFGGVNYSVYRGKSGAELTFGKERVTGQTEVTKFIENLFGTSAKLANKLMIARQKELSGVLGDGPTAVGQLIETLADFSLLDDIIDLIDTELPSGNTKSLEGRIDALAAACADPEMESTLEVSESLSRKAEEVAEKQAMLEVSKAKIDMAGLAEARSKLQTLANHKSKHEVWLSSLAEKKLIAEAVLESACPSEADIGKLQSLVADLASAERLHAEHTAFGKISAPAMEWEGSLEALNAEIASTRDAWLKAQETHQTSTLLVNTLEGRLIKETSCAFCGKDLQNVPEVATHNSELANKISSAKLEGSASSEAVKSLQSTLKELESVLRSHFVMSVTHNGFGSNILLDYSFVPHRATWVSELPEIGRDVSKDLADLKALRQAHLQHDVKVANAGAEVIKLSQQIVAAEEAMRGIDEQKLQQKIVEQEALVETQQIADAALSKLQAEHTALAHAKALIDSRNQQRADQAAKVLVDLQSAKADLLEQQSNNALMKKVREARPQITDKIWGMVLAAVTTYFSDIRGFQSTVTKDADGFKVNGKSAKGLSGSAEDALGLAIRTALTKTFLPNSNFMILDEMAAACDDRREAAMLGMIAKCGFPQVLMVTHSDQCDAYADNMIRLGE